MLDTTCVQRAVPVYNFCVHRTVPLYSALCTVRYVQCSVGVQCAVCTVHSGGGEERLRE